MNASRSADDIRRDYARTGFVVFRHVLDAGLIAETNRHAGHADIVRESIDRTAGLRAPGDNLAPGDAKWWGEYVNRLEQVARAFKG